MPFPSPTKARHSSDSGVESSTPKARRDSSSTLESLESLAEIDVGHQRYPTKGPQTGQATARKRISNACDYCQLKKSKCSPEEDRPCRNCIAADKICESGPKANLSDESMVPISELKQSEEKVGVRDWQLKEVYERVMSGVYGDGERPPTFSHFIASLNINPRTRLPTPNPIGPHRKSKLSCGRRTKPQIRRQARKVKKGSETPPAESPSLAARIHVLDNPVFSSSSSGQDIHAGQESPSFFGIPHPLEQVEATVSIETPYPATHYPPPILNATFHQHDVNMAPNGMQQFSSLQQYGNVVDYPDYTNGQDYSEPHPYDQNNNYQSHAQFNSNSYGDYGAFDYQNPYDQ